MVLGGQLDAVPDASLAPQESVDYPTWRPIRYEESGPVGFLHFDFYNGAMGTAQCEAAAAVPMPGPSRDRRA